MFLRSNDSIQDNLIISVHNNPVLFMESSVRARVGTILDFVYIKALVVSIIIQKAKFAGKKCKMYQELYNEVFHFHPHTSSSHLP